MKLLSRFTQELNAAKITDNNKKASNKSCSELNFLQKSYQAHVSISLRSGIRGLQRLPCLKHFNVLKWESRST